LPIEIIYISVFQSLESFTLTYKISKRVHPLAVKWPLLKVDGCRNVLFYCLWKANRHYFSPMNDKQPLRLHWLIICIALVSCEPYDLLPENGVLMDSEIKSNQSSAVSTETSTFFTNLFDTQGGGWTGGDGAYSIPLPDGRILWTFGDSFLGTVNPNYSRPGSALLNNIFVIQEGNALTTLAGGTTGQPKAYVRPPEQNGDFYWPGDGTVIGDKIYMFMLRIRLTGEGGPFGFEHVGTDVAIFSLPDIQLIRIEPLISTTQILAGVSIYEEDGYIYCYSTKSTFGKNALVARVHVDSLRDIEFWDGQGWGSEFVGSAFMLKEDGSPLLVSNMFSVFKTGDTYRLLTQQDFLGNKIELYTGDSPLGPWRYRQIIYETPESGNGLWTYNASVHPHIQHPEKGMLMTYSVNSSNFGDLFSDVRNYRPRFIWVREN
jgi:hypothetical protein